MFHSIEKKVFKIFWFSDQSMKVNLSYNAVIIVQITHPESRNLRSQAKSLISDGDEGRNSRLEQRKDKYRF